VTVRVIAKPKLVRSVPRLSHNPRDQLLNALGVHPHAGARNPEGGHGFALRVPHRGGDAARARLTLLDVEGKSLLGDFFQLPP
jgi:hypothetical protein